MMLNKSENLPRKDSHKNGLTWSPPEADQKHTGSPPKVHWNPIGSPPEVARWTHFSSIFELRILNWFENLRNFGFSESVIMRNKVEIRNWEELRNGLVINNLVILTLQRVIHWNVLSWFKYLIPLTCLKILKIFEGKWNQF